MKKRRTGRVVAMSLALCATGAIGYSIPQIKQVPKLEESVSKLESTRNTLTEANKEKGKRIGTLSVQVDDLNAQLTGAKTGLEMQAVEIEELKKMVQDSTNVIAEKDNALKAKDAEIASLKKSKAKPAPAPSPGGDFATGMTGFQVTWYNDSGATKSGRPTQDGVTVAVDPSVIPLGSLIRIRMPSGTVYERTAQDTGGAVKGRIVDIYANVSTTEIYRRGRTHGATVEILRRGW